MNTSQQPPCHPAATRDGNWKKAALWIVFGIWAVTLFILSSIPGNRFGPMPFNLADKVVHTTIFLIGTLVLVLAFQFTFKRTAWKTFLALFLLMVAIGVSDEFHQTFTPGRSGNDRGDLLADAIGAAIGIGCARLLHGKRRAKTNLPAPVGDRAA